MLKSSAHIVAKNSLMMILNYFLSAKASSVKPTPRIHLNRMAISSATTAPSVRLLAACFTYTTFPWSFGPRPFILQVYLLNRTINTQVGFTTPYELWFHTKPSVAHYRTFGTLAYSFIDKSLRTKFQAKGHMVIFIGYSATSKGWRFWNPSTDIVFESSNVIFDEGIGYSSSSFTSQTSPVSVPVHFYFHTDSSSSPSSEPFSFPVGVPPPLIEDIPPPVGDLDSPLSLPPPAEDTFDSPSSPLSSLPDPPTFQSDHPYVSSPTPLDPYDFNIPYSHPTPLSNMVDEPIQPKFKKLTDLYSDSSPPNIPPTTSFANMISSAETYREPATFQQATMSPQAKL